MKSQDNFSSELFLLIGTLRFFGSYFSALSIVACCETMALDTSTFSNIHYANTFMVLEGIMMIRAMPLNSQRTFTEIWEWIEHFSNPWLVFPHLLFTHTLVGRYIKPPIRVGISNCINRKQYFLKKYFILWIDFLSLLNGNI